MHHVHCLLLPVCTVSCHTTEVPPFTALLLVVVLLHAVATPTAVVTPTVTHTAATVAVATAVAMVAAMAVATRTVATGHTTTLGALTTTGEARHGCLQSVHGNLLAALFSVVWPGPGCVWLTLIRRQVLCVSNSAERAACASRHSQGCWRPRPPRLRLKCSTSRGPLRARTRPPWP